MHEFPSALLLPGDAFDIDKRQVMGRRVAGRAMAEGLAAHLHAGEKLTMVCFSIEEAQQLGAILQPHLKNGSELALTTSLAPESLTNWGCLHLPDPGLGHWSLLRSSSPPNAFSITGVIHTICSSHVLNSLEQLLIAPLYPWDALVCTSSSGKKSVEAAMESKLEQLTRRFGVQLPKPQGPELPIIPLAIDASPYDWQPKFSSRQEQRNAARKQLGLDENAFIVLFLGRLSFHSKAHPEVLYQILEELHLDKSEENKTSKNPIILLECGHIFNSEIAEAYKNLNIRYSNLEVYRLGGLQPATQHEKEQALAAADIFCSLADNLQETFGLSILEAMASELPVIASDWNGYRDLVNNKVTGYLIPTANTLAEYKDIDDLERNYRLGFIDYDKMIGLRSLSVIVNQELLKSKIRILKESTELRSRMGAAGKQSVKDKFNWEVVTSQYRKLWLELQKRRQGCPKIETLKPAKPVASYGEVFNHYSNEFVPNGPFQIRRNPLPIEILLCPMQAAFLQYLCGDELIKLANWLTSNAKQSPTTLHPIEDFIRYFQLIGIKSNQHKSIIAALLKLGVIKSEH